MSGRVSTDPTLGTGSTIGKYFSVVSMIPSVLLAVWVYLLLAAGSLHQTPSMTTLMSNNPIAHPEYLIATFAFAIAVALVGHPLQFALVQILEGYWGNSTLARNLRVRFVMGHLRRIELASRSRKEGRLQLRRLPKPVSGDTNEYLSPAEIAADPDAAATVVWAQAHLDAWEIVNSQYPDERTATLPTRLGNVLRRHELVSGSAVHLPILDWATHIGMVANPTHTAYVNDQRTQLDLAVRMAASTFFAAAITFLLLWPYGWPSLLSLIPYVAAFFSYRGAVVCADGYGRALRAWVDLNRLRLYAELGLANVATTDEEREQNDALVDLILGQDTFQMRLRQSGDG
jgi:hypothetical protein